MSALWFVVAVLGVWRVTHLLAAEDGPGDLIVRLRSFAGDGAWGRVLDCFYCLSLWVAAPFAFALADLSWELPLLWLGLSGGAILLERVTNQQPLAARYVEHEDHGGPQRELLRK
jgi:hypothetical protein